MNSKTKLKIGLMLLVSMSSFGDSWKTAHQLHNRITGVPPSKDVLQRMSILVASNQVEQAAKEAMNNKNFYNVVLKNWAKPWTNEDETNRIPFNDYVATIIGVIRDDRPFSSVLHDDILYTVDSGDIAPYSSDSNDHYKEAEEKNIDLKEALSLATQSQMNGISDTAGIITTRAAGEAFFSDGTNRAMTRYTFMNFLCKDFEDLHDVNLPDFRVRQDVDRKPGNDSRTFKNKCVGCHAGQDALGGAFAYFDYVDGEVKHTPGTVVEKINRNNLFPAGYVTTNDSWLNLWANGQNASLGWRGSQNGAGAKSLGRMLSSSKAFSRCMVQKSYKLICLNDAKETLGETQIDNYATMFESTMGFRMKDLFSKMASICFKGGN
ncbi:hypothetical protein [Halobacteriovorax sp. HLS]|uniref:hypothetical protein n=1 Tax=Halobacteriovorax sp. HLS TaxID=2234000 RepID=UPI000FDA03A5|nr:hypothetical protein [Halobacteriovorax sp. HLS]